MDQSGNVLPVSPDMLQEMSSSGVLVSKDTGFGDLTYSITPDVAKFTLVYAVKYCKMAVNTDDVSLADPRTDILKYPKLSLIMKLVKLGWEPLPARQFASAYELGQTNMFDCNSSRLFSE